MLDTHQIETLKAALRARKNPDLHAQSPDPDEATAQALAVVLDPTANVVPSGVFQELTRRNNALANASRPEIIAAISRQIVLLEATATRFFQRAATAPSPSAAAEFTRSALAAERVLLQALGAIYQMDQNPVPPESPHDDVA